MLTYFFKMPYFQVTVAGTNYSPTSVQNVSPPNGSETNQGNRNVRILSQGKGPMPMDIALMKLIPSLNAFNNDEITADVLSQRLLRALIIKDVANQTGIPKGLFVVQDVQPSAEQLPRNSEMSTSPRFSEGGGSPIASQKKTVSFSNLPAMSTSPSASNLTSFPPPLSSSKKVVIFTQDSHCHREDVHVFSASDAPSISSSPPMTSSYMIPPSPSRFASSLPPMQSSVQRVASSPSATSTLLSLPQSLAFTQVSSSTPGVEVYNVSEVLTSHVKNPVGDDSHNTMDCNDEADGEEEDADFVVGWRAEGSAKVVVDRSKRSIVIEQYLCRYSSC